MIANNENKDDDCESYTSSVCEGYRKILSEFQSILLRLINDNETDSKDTVGKEKKRKVPRNDSKEFLENLFTAPNNLHWTNKVMYTCVILGMVCILNTFILLSTEKITTDYSNQRMLDSVDAGPVKVSLVILTYKKRKQFRALIRSIKPQKTNFRYEVIIADSGCMSGLYNDIETIFLDDLKSSYTAQSAYYQDFKYLQLCDNPGYSIGNNRAYALADPSSEYVLFLNDDLVMRDSHFIQSMVDLFETQADTAGGVGCVLLNEKGDTILEAGSSVWSDGSTQGYARDRKDLLADDLQYTRPVDYISGACLMVEMNLLRAIEGFDGAAFPAYFEDTDMQMKIQHVHNKKVWLQPRAVALHAEHGSFGASNSYDLMVSSHKVFKARWETALKAKHIFPGPLVPNAQFQSFRASDTRGRISTANEPNILYVVEYIPYKLNGNGRQYDNLIMLQKMGHRITLMVLGSKSDFCYNDNCGKQGLQQNGIEVIESSNDMPLEKLLIDRPFYYNIIILNRKNTFDMFNETIHQSKEMTEMIQHSAIIYDTNALNFREDEKIFRMLQSSSDGITHLPGVQKYTNSLSESHDKYIKDRDSEISILNEVDAIVSVSSVEEDIIIDLLQSNLIQDEAKEKVCTIGNAMVVDYDAIALTPSYESRNGILFVASFLQKDMQYNGDAIYDFLHETYPLILEDLPNTKLTIAGRDIPQLLYDYVKNSILLDGLVTFLESPLDLSDLYNHARLFIAPHVYGSGIQYKVSEAMAAGVPTVISGDTARNFGDSISNTTCIGETHLEFKECVVEIYSDVELWNELQFNGLTYVENNHQREAIEKRWETLITSTTKRKLKNPLSLVELDTLPPIGPASTRCKTLDASYISRYVNVKHAIDMGSYNTGLEHFYATDSGAGYVYNVDHEEAYLRNHPDVNAAVIAGDFKSGWHHFELYGKRQEGYQYSPEDEAKYRADNIDIDTAMEQGAFPTAWMHFQSDGKREGRFYGCW